MTTLFEAMPGAKLTIPEVTDTFAEIFKKSVGEDEGGEFIFRSTQFNLILHNGSETKIEHVLDCFYNAVAFAKKYPCRLIVLCPDRTKQYNESLEGKLFSECYIGEANRTCCDALILGYSIENASFLEHQVSLWLDSELPTYYWFNQVRGSSIEKYYEDFAQNCQKIIYDSYFEPEDFKAVKWTKPEILYDLAWARTLTIRQSLGQYLSAFKPSFLTENLKEVTILYKSHFKTEAQWLSKWSQECLSKCCEKECTIDFTCVEEPQSGKSIEATWVYGDKKIFNWWFCEAKNSAHLQSNFFGVKRDVFLRIMPLTPVEALAAAVFY